jgi:predicted AAA+ superfamily ATPase
VTEVAEVQRTIRDGGKLFLIGPRRYGKTSILRTAADKLEAKKAVVIRINAESCPSLDIFVGRLIALAAAGLKGPVERVGSDLRSFFNRLRPEVTFNVSHQS